ncbi:hypothetical protein G7Y41_07040 [Schaalia sp. ZJ405]|uniref:hypothetical protein n=1 Tax=Schaalia sp. ZJ405 TaxID=2709403 RepID=UPI0013EA9C75|nr:hypothetical protein [Schaalia sp. ZJ405]QPK80809.1 hypothetical protein G7Y41_07040 [Schaalia sp. ZJ405]
MNIEPSGPSVVEAVTTGTSKDVLVAMRARLAYSFDDPNTPARDLAAITRRMTDLDDRIRSIELAEQEETDEADEDITDEEWEGV